MKTIKKAELVKLVIDNFAITAADANAKTEDELLALVNSLNIDAAKPVAEENENRRMRVVIHEQDGPDGNQDVVIGVNGQVAQIKREHEVELTMAHIGVLENALYRRFEQIRDRPGEYVERVVRRYNFSVLGQAS